MGLVRPACMTTILFLLMIFVLSPSSAMDLPGASDGGHRRNEEVRFIFQTWMSKHGKTYTNALGQKEERFQIFKDNLRFIDQHNAKNLSYQLGLTRFADLTVQEYRNLFPGSPIPKERPLRISRRYVPLGGSVEVPSAVDWRLEGAVTEIRNQGTCNSCWAFSSVATVESINKIMTDNLVSLSEQELVDCNFDNNGCDGGGTMDRAFDFIINNNGLVSQVEYPYQGAQGYCSRNEYASNKVTIDSYEDLPANDEISLQNAVSHQPVSVGFDRKSQEFMLYTSGIYNGPCGTDLDHALVLVGYGYENDQDYWIARNSWGINWGEAGYAKIARNTESSAGMCGIAMMASYPIKNQNSNA